ncbi:MAG: hypothetical protein VKI39_02175 [Synechococcus sp.]|nr:hypothetical protein [Synechococcus sp.]
MGAKEAAAPLAEHAFEMAFEGYFTTVEAGGRDRRRMVDGWFWVIVEGRDLEACRATAVEVARSHLEATFDVAPFSMYWSRYVGENDGRWKLAPDTQAREGAWQSGMIIVTSHPWSYRRWWYALRASLRR